MLALLMNAWCLLMRCVFIIYYGVPFVPGGVPFVPGGVPFVPGGVPCGPQNGGLPIAMWGCGLCSNGDGRHTTRIAIQLAFWRISDNVILIMFGTSKNLMICGILISRRSA
jgi:hypothetical protein